MHLLKDKENACPFCKRVLGKDIVLNKWIFISIPLYQCCHIMHLHDFWTCVVHHIEVATIDKEIVAANEEPHVVAN